MFAYFFFLTLLSLLALFQIALVLGAPLGKYAWGGQHSGKLPNNLRIASLSSLLIYAAIAFVATEKVGLTSVLPDAFTTVLWWITVGYLGIAILMNGISRSRPERYVMTPVAIALFVTALVIALA